MKNNDTFKITYYSNSDKMTITRNGKWTDKCREWISNKGIECLVYLDLDKTEELGKDQYRTASRDWWIKWN